MIERVKVCGVRGGQNGRGDAHKYLEQAASGDVTNQKSEGRREKARKASVREKGRERCLTNTARRYNKGGTQAPREMRGALIHEGGDGERKKEGHREVLWRGE